MRWLSKDKGDGKIGLDLSCPHPPALGIGSGEIIVGETEIVVESPRVKSPKVKTPKAEGDSKGLDISMPHISLPSFHLKSGAKKDVHAGDVELDDLSKPGKE